MKEISDFISNVGFPIFISLLMMYQNQNFNKMYEETVNHFSQKIESNTEILSKVWNELSTKKEGD